MCVQPTKAAPSAIAASVKTMATPSDKKFMRISPERRNIGSNFLPVGELLTSSQGDARYLLSSASSRDSRRPSTLMTTTPAVNMIARIAKYAATMSLTRSSAFPRREKYLGQVLTVGKSPVRSP